MTIYLNHSRSNPSQRIVSGETLLQGMEPIDLAALIPGDECKCTKIHSLSARRFDCNGQHYHRGLV